MYIHVKCLRRNILMRMVLVQVQGLTVVTLLFAAVAGDVTALHRHYLQVT